MVYLVGAGQREPQNHSGLFLKLALKVNLPPSFVWMSYGHKDWKTSSLFTAASLLPAPSHTWARVCALAGG